MLTLTSHLVQDAKRNPVLRLRRSNLGPLLARLTHKVLVNPDCLICANIKAGRATTMYLWWLNNIVTVKPRYLG